MAKIFNPMHSMFETLDRDFHSWFLLAGDAKIELHITRGQGVGGSLNANVSI